MKQIIIKSYIELRNYLTKFGYDENGNSIQDYYLIKTDNHEIAIGFRRLAHKEVGNETEYSECIPDINSWEMSPDEIEEYVKNKYVPEVFEKMLAYENTLQRGNIHYEINDYEHCGENELITYPCEIIDVFTDSQLLDYLLSKQAQKKKDVTLISELEKLCFEYPPNLSRIEDILEEIKDYRPLYINGLSYRDVWSYSDFLSEFIEDYFVSINAKFYDKCYLNEENNKWDDNDVDKYIHDEQYAYDIIKIFLLQGYDMTALSGNVGANCLRNLTYSHFNKYMSDIAKMLLNAGADPTIGDDEGYTAAYCATDHMWGASDARGCTFDPYLDNADAIIKLSDMLNDEAEKIYASYQTFDYKELYDYLPKGFSKDIGDCPKCQNDGDDVVIYKNGDVISMICTKCGFRVKNVCCEREYENLVKQWNYKVVDYGKKD